MLPLPGLPLDKALRFNVYLSADPLALFATTADNHPLLGKNHPMVNSRMVSHARPEDQIIIFTDGSCLNQNSRDDIQSRKAGCGVVYGTKTPSGMMLQHPSSHCFQLEHRGPDGNYHVATSNRAELRAAAAALELKSWAEEGWCSVVIITDSTYVVRGITDWVSKWKARQWTKATGEEVANKDLWKRLLRLVNAQAERGCDVRFWHIDREANARAENCAKLGANRAEADEYTILDLAHLEKDFQPRLMK